MFTHKVEESVLIFLLDDKYVAVNVLEDVEAYKSNAFILYQMYVQI